MMNFQIKLYIFLLGLLVVSCTGLLSDPHEVELQSAYERSEILLAEARKTSDTSNLSAAFTQNAINVIEEELIKEKEFRLKENLSFVGGEEAEIVWVDVIEYNPPEAIIEVKYFFRTYEYDLQTGQLTYYDPPRKYWRTMKVRMRLEDGVWKFDETLEFVDWSG